jgi:hypothetical protein
VKDPDRRRLIGMLVVLVVLGAIVAGVVANAGGDQRDDGARLRATGSSEADDTTGSTVALPELTTSTTVETTTSSAPPPTPPPRSATTTSRPPSTTVAPPSPTTTTSTLPPAVLDVGPESCSAASPAPIAGAVVGVQLPDGLHEVSLDGTRDVLVADSTASTGAAWSANGRRLAFARPSPTRQDANHYAASDLVVVDPARGCSRVLAPRGADSLTMASWSPDGSALSYVRFVAGNWSQPRLLETARDDGTDVTRLAQGAIIGGTWAPDGSGRIAFGQDGGMRVRARDGSVIVVDGATGGAEDESWSPDATKVIYTISVHQGIWVGNADGTGVRDLSPKSSKSPNGIFWSRFSPDGRRIAFGWGPEVWVVGADGGNPRQVTTQTGYGGPYWSPAGDELIYDGEGGVRAIPVDGGGPSRLVHAGKVVAVFRRP